MKQLARFLFVGLFNTGFGYCIIFICMYALAFSPELSNVIGYAIGMVVSYGLNRNFTFRSKQRYAPEIRKFVLVFAVSYALNLTLLVFMTRHLHAEKGVSQITAGLAYVVASYLLSKFYAFRDRVSI
jgi:putative flippase GtrA